MKPIRYTENGDTITFHYSFTDLRNFLSHGFKEGNNGFLIVKKSGNIITYRGFGTIENCNTNLISIHKTHWKSFDGEFNIDSVMNPKSFFEEHTVQYFFLKIKEDGPNSHWPRGTTK